MFGIAVAGLIGKVTIDQIANVAEIGVKSSDS